MTNNTLTDDAVKQNLGANVRRLLDDRGWSQTLLARRSGENDAMISRILHGKQMPTAGVVARIATAFDVSADRLCQAPPAGNPKKAP